MENDKLQNSILKELKGQRGRVGFYYKNLVTGEEFGLRGEEEFLPASVIKLPMLLLILKWASEGRADLSETIRIRQSDKVPPSGALTLFTGEPEVDVETLCRLMISISDNVATNVLIDHYGIEEFESGFRGLGLSRTHLRRKLFDSSSPAKDLNNGFSPLEAGALLEQLYRGAFISEEVSKQALDILLTQQIRHKIAGMLLEQVPFAGKTGETDTISNDVGILYARRPFVVCFAGNGVDVPAFNRVIRELSFLLYQEADREAL